MTELPREVSETLAREFETIDEFEDRVQRVAVDHLKLPRPVRTQFVYGRRAPRT